MKKDQIILEVEEDIFTKDLIYKTFSRKFYGYLKSTNAVFFVNENIVSISHNLKKGDTFKIEYVRKTNTAKESDKEINIIYEDEYLLVVDKEANLLTIPSRTNFTDSLYNRLIHKIDSSINIITRLDKLTKGLVLVSKKPYLVDSIKDNIINKIYLAKTIKPLENSQGIINLPIKKSEGIKRIIHESGKDSITKYELIDSKTNLYKINLITGRTHQIRVHFAHLGSPLVNDNLYGEFSEGDLALICSELEMIHPISKKKMKFKSNYRLE